MPPKKRYLPERSIAARFVLPTLPPGNAIGDMIRESLPKKPSTPKPSYTKPTIRQFLESFPRDNPIGNRRFNQRELIDGLVESYHIQNQRPRLDRQNEVAERYQMAHHDRRRNQRIDSMFEKQEREQMGKEDRNIKFV